MRTFFTDIFSTGGKIVPDESLSSIQCPHCGKQGALYAFHSDHTLRILGIVVLRRQAKRFAVCASCGYVSQPPPRERKSPEPATGRCGNADKK